LYCCRILVADFSFFIDRIKKKVKIARIPGVAFAVYEMLRKSPERMLKP
jgi:hypothetical protein